METADCNNTAAAVENVNLEIRKKNYSPFIFLLFDQVRMCGYMTALFGTKTTALRSRLNKFTLFQTRSKTLNLGFLILML